MARWENEIFKTQEPPDDILCTTCVYRLKPVTAAGHTQDRSKYALCEQYSMKPQDVLWGRSPCPHYKREVK